MDQGVDHPWTTKRTTYGPPLDQEVDHPSKELLLSAHMTAMRSTKKTFIILSATAYLLVAVTGCAGASVTDEQRAAYEELHFGSQHTEQSDLSASSPAPADAVMATLAHPSQWPTQAHGKLCDYTRTLLSNADRDGTAVPDKSRAAAERILEHC